MLDKPFNKRKQKSGQKERERIHVENEYDDGRMNGNFKGYQKHDLHKIIRENNYSQKRHGTHTNTPTIWNRIHFRFFFSTFVDLGRRVHCINSSIVGRESELEDKENESRRVSIQK